MKLPKKICGYRPLKIRDLFTAFNDLETKIISTNDGPVWVPRRFDSDFIATQLQVTPDAAEQLLLGLTADGWLESDKPVPTHKGMALAQYVVRPRIPRATATFLLTKSIEWARKVNAHPKARVKVSKIDVYGSYLTDVIDLGDLDLVVLFNSEELGDDFQPEDDEMIDRLLAQLKRISKYISPANEIDRHALTEATFETVFEA